MFICTCADNTIAVYFLQSLDKTALSYAAVFGLIEHTNLVGDQYSWLGAIVYVAQLIWQPVVAYFLVKLPTGKFLAVMVFCWLVATRVIHVIGNR